MQEPSGKPLSVPSQLEDVQGENGPSRELVEKLTKKVQQQAKLLQSMSAEKQELMQKMGSETAPSSISDFPSSRQRNSAYMPTSRQQHQIEVNELQGVIALLTSEKNQQSERLSVVIKELKKTKDILKKESKEAVSAALQKQMTSLKNEKNALAESLRNETLVAEEQRAYIQILKNALDQKAEEMGLGRKQGQILFEVSDLRARHQGMVREQTGLREQLETVRRDLEDKTKLVQSLEATRSRQRKELTSVQEHATSLTEAVDGLKKERNALTESMEEHLSEKVSLSKKLELLQREHGETLAELEKCKSDLSISSKRVEQLSTHLKSTSESAEELQLVKTGLLGDLETRRVECSSQSEQLQILKGEKADLLAVQDELLSAVEKYKEELGQLSGKYEEKERTLHKVTRTSSNLEESLSIEQERIAQAVKRQQETEDVVEVLTKELSQLRFENAGLKESNDSSNTNSTKLSESLRKLQMTSDDLQSENSSLKRKVQRLEDELKETSDYLNKFKHVSTQLEASLENSADDNLKKSSRIRMLETELSEAQAEIRRAQGVVASERETVEKVSSERRVLHKTLSQQVELSETRSADLASRVAELEREIMELRPFVERYNDATARCENLKQECAQRQGNEQRLEQSLSQTSQQLSEIREKFAASSHQLQLTSTSSMEKDESIRRLNKRLLSLEEELSTEKHALAEERNAKNRLQESILALDRQVMTLSSRAESAEVDSLQAHADYANILTAVREDCARLREQLDSVRMADEALKETIHELSLDLQRAKEREHSLQGDLNSARKQLVDWETRGTLAERENAFLSVELNELRELKSLLCAQLDELSSEVRVRGGEVTNAHQQLSQIALESSEAQSVAQGEIGRLYALIQSLKAELQDKSEKLVLSTVRTSNLEGAQTSFQRDVASKVEALSAELDLEKRNNTMEMSFTKNLLNETTRDKEELSRKIRLAVDEKEMAIKQADSAQSRAAALEHELRAREKDLHRLQEEFSLISKERNREHQRFTEEVSILKMTVEETSKDKSMLDESSRRMQHDLLQSQNEKQAQIGQLQDNIDGMRTHVLRMETELQRKDTEISDMRNEIKALTHARDDYEKRTAFAEERCENLQRMKQELEAMYDAYKLEQTTQASMNSDHVHRIKVLEEETEKLSSKLLQRDQEVSAANRRCNDLSLKEAELQRELHSAGHRLAQAEEDCRELGRILKETENDRTKIANELELLNDKHKLLLGDADNLRRSAFNEAASLQSRTSELEERLNSRVAAAEGEVSSLRRLNATLTDAKNALEDQVTKLARDLQRANSDLESLTRKETQHLGRIRDLEIAHRNDTEELTSQKESLRVTRARMEELTAVLGDRDKHVLNVTEQATSLTHKAQIAQKEADHKGDLLRRASEQVTELEQENRRLKKDLDGLRGSKDSVQHALASMEASLQKQKSVLDEKERENELQKSASSRVQQELESRLASAQAEVAHLRSSLEMSEVARKLAGRELEAESSSHGKEKELLRRDQRTLVTQIQSLKKELQHVRL